MMRPNWVVVLAFLMALAVTEVWAQQAPSRQPAERGTPRQTWHIPADVLLSSTVIGARVKNREGKDLGEIDHLVIEPRTGRVSHAVLGLGGLAGVGEVKVVIDWKDIKLMADPSLPRRTIASVDQAVVERAPRWDRAEDRGARNQGPSASPPTMPPVPGAPAPRY